jgi:hypothetical protein
VPGPARPDRFVPSTHGFAFTNSWPALPAFTFWRARPASRLRSVRIGNTANGLCGGMVFAALDFWHAGRRPPADRPAGGEPLFRFLVRRLIDSWRLPVTGARYYRWMWRSDADVAARTRREWPAIRADLERGVPVPLGIVTTASRDPRLIGRNHQVLAYAVQDQKIQVYDPNRGQRDDVFIAAQPDGYTHNLDIAYAIRGFFRVAYRARKPPPS